MSSFVAPSSVPSSASLLVRLLISIETPVQMSFGEAHEALERIKGNLRSHSVPGSF